MFEHFTDEVLLDQISKMIGNVVAIDHFVEKWLRLRSQEGSTTNSPDDSSF
jgi:hypothetical protein